MSNFVVRNKISADEIDILMLVMLQNSRRIVQFDRGRLESPSLLICSKTLLKTQLPSR